eukprot:4958009-Prymnesium_polylepis.1
MRARCASATDARSKADRATIAVVPRKEPLPKTADVARWAGDPPDPARATPTANDASPGPPGRL